MKKKIILSIIGILILIGGYFAWTLFGPTVKQPEIKYFFVATGDNYEDVRADLHDQKIISSKKMFDIASKVVGYKKIKPGRWWQSRVILSNKGSGNVTASGGLLRFARSDVPNSKFLIPFNLFYFRLFRSLSGDAPSPEEQVKIKEEHNSKVYTETSDLGT